MVGFASWRVKAGGEDEEVEGTASLRANTGGMGSTALDSVRVNTGGAEVGVGGRASCRMNAGGEASAGASVRMNTGCDDVGLDSTVSPRVKAGGGPGTVKDANGDSSVRVNTGCEEDVVDGMASLRLNTGGDGLAVTGMALPSGGVNGFDGAVEEDDTGSSVRVNTGGDVERVVKGRASVREKTGAATEADSGGTGRSSLLSEVSSWPNPPKNPGIMHVTSCGGVKGSTNPPYRSESRLPLWKPKAQGDVAVEEDDGGSSVRVNTGGDVERTVKGGTSVREKTAGGEGPVKTAGRIGGSTGDTEWRSVWSEVAGTRTYMRVVVQDGKEDFYAMSSCCFARENRQPFQKVLQKSYSDSKPRQDGGFLIFIPTLIFAHYPVGASLAHRHFHRVSDPDRSAHGDLERGGAGEAVGMTHHDSDDCVDQLVVEVTVVRGQMREEVAPWVQQRRQVEHSGSLYFDDRSVNFFLSSNFAEPLQSTLDIGPNRMDVAQTSPQVQEPEWSSAATGGVLEYESGLPAAHGRGATPEQNCRLRSWRTVIASEGINCWVNFFGAFFVSQFAKDTSRMSSYWVLISASATETKLGHENMKNWYNMFFAALDKAYDFQAQFKLNTWPRYTLGAFYEYEKSRHVAGYAGSPFEIVPIADTAAAQKAGYNFDLHIVGNDHGQIGLLPEQDVDLSWCDIGLSRSHSDRLTVDGDGANKSSTTKSGAAKSTEGTKSAGVPKIADATENTGSSKTTGTTKSAASPTASGATTTDVSSKTAKPAKGARKRFNPRMSRPIKKPAEPAKPARRQLTKDKKGKGRATTVEVTTDDDVSNEEEEDDESEEETPLQDVRKTRSITKKAVSFATPTTPPLSKTRRATSAAPEPPKRTTATPKKRARSQSRDVTRTAGTNSGDEDNAPSGGGSGKTTTKKPVKRVLRPAHPDHVAPEKNFDPLPDHKGRIPVYVIRKDG
ncbi:uncharacterized protein BXZ73DRAFT_81876, partial [Epithele typhae]|uniref:uncharacterized protein n=1 Tax=Epithele typhae TaxID=378194 RepID=UPI002007875F